MSFIFNVYGANQLAVSSGDLIWNTVTRLDIDVLARICTVLGCDVGDLLEYEPPSCEEG